MSAIAVPSGFRLDVFDRLDSTNAEALRRLGAGTAHHGDAIFAHSQTSGRGRRGRTWHSPEGNLHLTLIAAPPAGVPAGQIAFVAALAVGDALARLVPVADDVRCKWPNDLLLNGRKLAGLLIEGGGSRKGQGLAIGIGVNVAEAPHAAAHPAAALRELGTDATAGELVAPLCAAFGERYASWLAEGFAPIRSAWLARAHGLGEVLEAHMPDGTVHHGVFRDLGPDGALILEAAGGTRRAIAAGDVFFAAA